MTSALYTKKDFKKLPEDFRIGAVVADGMWWSCEKWSAIAGVEVETLQQWIDDAMESGLLVQSETGSRSYRFPLESIEKWYAENNLSTDTQIVESLFAPATRIWDGMTETEGFLSAPLREIGIFTFECTPEMLTEISHALKGVARIREDKPGVYKAYSLSSQYVKNIVNEVIENKFAATSSAFTGRLRLSSYRRETVDFTPEFVDGFVGFYKGFARTLLKGSMETIRIYLPDVADQESQIIYWVLKAAEKFNERRSVPFSGYLNTVLSRWPYDLPTLFLGKELSFFQREKSKALKRLHSSTPGTEMFSHQQIAREMKIDDLTFNDLEERHRTWLKTKNATTLTWDESSDQRATHPHHYSTDSPHSDFAMLSTLSRAVVDTALSTKKYSDALMVVSQMDATHVDVAALQSLSPEFTAHLAVAIKERSRDKNE